MQGRVAVHEVFPEIVEVGIKFLQQDEWAAQKRRLNSDFDSCGAGPSAVRDHLVWSIPGLKELFVLNAEINGKENAANQSMQETTAKELFVGLFFSNGERYSADEMRGKQFCRCGIVVSGAS